MSAEAVDSESSESSSGYEDGLGRRTLAFDRETGGMLERLVLRPEMAAFERVLRERLAVVGSLEDERFTVPRAIEHDADDRLTVVSECVNGRRLADVIDSAGDHGIVAGLDAGLGLLLELLPALSRLHDAGIMHGTLAPGRVVVTPAGQVVLLDAIYGEALERLQLTRRRLWSEFRLAFPPTAGIARFDKSADLTHAAMIAASLTVGRPLRDEEYPEGLPTLRQEILEIASIRGSKSFAEAVDTFFASLLPLAGRRTPRASADEAAIDLRKLIRKELGITTCRAALLDFISQVEAADGERATAEAEAKRVAVERHASEQTARERAERERAEREHAEQARLEAERIERERAEAARRDQERAEAERRETERVAAEQREAEKLAAERIERERAEAARRDQERAEAERREAERVAAQRREAERLDAERREAERRAAERERIERERAEAERRERERIEAERKERERAEAERREAERIAAERRERERLEAERKERERLERERQEAERRERERLEAERRERERLEAERKERERLERERLEAERKERERLEAERRERERLEAERKKREEAERRERERLEAERKAREEAERRAREEAERKKREEAERKAREEAERKKREEAERKAREEAERKAREEAERKERARLEAERKERERQEAERKKREEAERKERERQEAERKKREEAERKERERLEAERKKREEAERKERERLEAERVARERAEAERREQERREAERKERERQEAERRERERVEAERREAERVAAERKEAERKEAERKEAERKERERQEAERRERERVAAAETPSSGGWLIPPDRANSFEPVPDPQAQRSNAPRAYPIYHPPSEPGAWTAALPPEPPAIEIAPVAAAKPAPVPLAPPAPPPSISVAPSPIRLKDSKPISIAPAAPRVETRREREPEPPAPIEPYIPDTGHETARTIPWKLVAAGVVLIVGLVGAAKFFNGGDELPVSTGKITKPVATPAKPAADPAPVPKNAGRVTITTNPPGARVLIDGKTAGESPLTLEPIPPGRHVFTMIGDNITAKRTLRVEAGKAMEINMELFSGFVAISSPILLEVSENGKVLGSSAEQIILSPGRHDLRVANKDLGYAATQPVEVQGGETARVNVDPKGTANINAAPWAEVFIDGDKVGETPLANIAIRLGVREIVFRNPQFPDRKVVVTVTTTETANVSVDFNK